MTKKSKTSRTTIILRSILAIAIIASIVVIKNKLQHQIYPANEPINTNETVLQIQNKNLRDKIINYTVMQGDTLESIAKEFGISVNTIIWENNLPNENPPVRQILRILPISGVSHHVVPGDTLDSLAIKYHADKQAIADFPFNDFANPQTFTLLPGTTIIIPNGSMPASEVNTVVQNYYNWYITCISNYFAVKQRQEIPTQDCSYNETNTLTSNLVSTLQQKRGGDPVLCAANIPGKITFDDAIVSQNTAIVPVHTIWSIGSTKEYQDTIQVGLTKIENQWKIDAITCSN